jgi:hypothetical protein
MHRARQYAGGMGRAFLWCFVVAAGCSKSASGPSGGSATGTAGAGDPCSAAALGLGGAVQLTAWKMPDGCALKDVGASIILRSEADATAHVVCTGAPLGNDFAKTALVVNQTTLSPAATGVLAFDDGKLLTWVTRFRTPCPDDPQPMPVPVSLVFPVEANAGREFDDKSCTAPPACN